jgi:5-methyltetrahydropteroyltriglutamate--homocysteine methyltransferase
MTMAQEDLPPFRADHVGSLLRPRELIEARDAYAAGSIDAVQLKQVEDRAIAAVIRLQEEVGLESITDGEYRRPNWRDGFVRAVEGLVTTASPFHFRNEKGESRPTNDAPFATTRIRRAKGITTDEFSFVRKLTKRTPKVTMPSPSFMHFFLGPEAFAKTAYADVDAYFGDLIAIYREEIVALAALGARYLQIDEVPLALLCDPDIRQQIRARGEDPDRLVELYVDATNAAIRDRPTGMRVALHMCRGNSPTMWLGQGGYEAIAEKVFSGIEVDGFFLEFDTPRAGGFEPLRFIPRGKRAMMGLVSTKNRDIESADILKRRLEEASGHYPIEHMGLCPQCGFASGAKAQHLDVDIERAKLARIVEVARDVWGATGL